MKKIGTIQTTSGRIYHIPTDAISFSHDKDTHVDIDKHKYDVISVSNIDDISMGK